LPTGERLCQNDPVNDIQEAKKISKRSEGGTHEAEAKQKEVEGLLPKKHKKIEDEVAELMRRLTQCLC